jgi:Family of unknown function (DUF5678)
MSTRFAWKGSRRARNRWSIDIWPLIAPMQPVRVSKAPRRWGFEPCSESEFRFAEVKSQAAVEFAQQKAAFNEIPPLILAQYDGQFVASRNGVIVDNDRDLASLTRRFRERYGKVSVYITRVRRIARMPTPFLR